ncbi:MAG: acyltransferase domain-containing protein [Chloroflexota bacterium]|nr:acyltransferase domain-containing protein [Chloroflexota bacterium]
MVLGQRRAAPLGEAEIKERLSQDGATRDWAESLETLGAPKFEIGLPSAEELRPVLLDLAIPHEDIDLLIAALPTPGGSAGHWWLLQRCVHSLVRDMGAIDGPPPFPSLPERIGLLHRYFYVYVFVAVLPHVQAYHRARSIPDAVSRLTLADLGRNMAVHRHRYQSGGLADPDWLMLHFRGVIYQLGRLQFERTTLGNRTGSGVAAVGLPYGPGDPALSVHIPAYYGPLTPEACDASLACAQDFFPRHFPEETYEIGVCHSWLLDTQLAQYLPADANIIQFQNRFLPAYQLAEADDEGTVRFVFGRSTIEPDNLPRGTTLERAVGDHLRAGRHWFGGAGWLRL